MCIVCVYIHTQCITHTHYSVSRITSTRRNKLIFIARSVEKVTDLSLSCLGHLSNTVLDLETAVPKPHGSWWLQSFNLSPRGHQQQKINSFLKSCFLSPDLEKEERCQKQVANRKEKRSKKICFWDISQESNYLFFSVTFSTWTGWLCHSNFSSCESEFICPILVVETGTGEVVTEVEGSD